MITMGMHVIYILYIFYVLYIVNIDSLVHPRFNKVLHLVLK